MRARERPTGPGVIKFLFAVFPIDQFKLAAKVFTVTLGAALRLDLRAGVKTAIGVDALANCAMALQTFGGRDFIALFVALCAIVQAFEFGVKLRQVAGR